MSGGTRVFQETAQIHVPDETYAWPVSVAIDGDWLIATGEKDLDVTTGTVTDSSAWLYRRQSNGSWTLLRRLVQSFAPTNFNEPLMNVDMQGGIAVLQKEHATWIFERSGDNWVAVPSPIETDGMDVEVSDGTIAVTAGFCDWITNGYRENSSGAWALVRTTPAETSPECENEDDRGDVDVSENAVIVATVVSETNPPSARIFEGPFGTTPIMTRLLAPEGTFQVGFGGAVALDPPTALVRDVIPDVGTQAFTKDASGQWVNSGSLLRPDDFRQKIPKQIELRDGLAILGHPTTTCTATLLARSPSFNATTTARSVMRLSCCQAMQAHSTSSGSPLKSAAGEWWRRRARHGGVHGDHQHLVPAPSRSGGLASARLHQ